LFHFFELLPGAHENTSNGENCREGFRSAWLILCWRAAKETNDRDDAVDIDGIGRLSHCGWPADFDHVVKSFNRILLCDLAPVGVH
jgi:hypothetical protein